MMRSRTPNPSLWSPYSSISTSFEIIIYWVSIHFWDDNLSPIFLCVRKEALRFTIQITSWLCKKPIYLINFYLVSIRPSYSFSPNAHRPDDVLPRCRHCRAQCHSGALWLAAKKRTITRLKTEFVVHLDSCLGTWCKLFWYLMKGHF